MMTAIALSQVSKVYRNGTVALKDVDLTVETGQFVSLVGASGCGKSTVLRLIAGLSQLSSGQMIWGSTQLQQQLAFVFQEPALMPWATVQENVYLPLKLQGISTIKARDAIAEALELVELQDVAAVYPRQLSGGMKMRVSIARALVTQPAVLLMDEPFGALDEMTRSKLNHDLLHIWQQKQWTVVFVTHNIYEAVYLSHRVLVMGTNPGRMIAEVAIEAAYPRTEAFRTSPSCNHYCREVAQLLARSKRPEDW